MPAAESGGCCSPLSAAALTNDEAASLARAFAALADPARLRLLSLIATSDTGEVCACDLVAPLGKSQPTVSHHLKVLREAGLVTSDKRGSWMWYRAVPGRLGQLRAVLA
jgi:ArsR family transcriptional regulator